MTLTLATKFKVATLLGSDLVHVTFCPDFILAVYRQIPVIVPTNWQRSLPNPYL